LVGVSNVVEDLDLDLGALEGTVGDAAGVVDLLDGKLDARSLVGSVDRVLAGHGPSHGHGDLVDIASGAAGFVVAATAGTQQERPAGHNGQHCTCSEHSSPQIFSMKCVTCDDQHKSEELCHA